ncbi:Uncharacterised protein [uncultured Eubacterium sp.]|nr:Uncharacterised protein [uncultured Eubacterium sp.]
MHRSDRLLHSFFKFIGNCSTEIIFFFSYPYVDASTLSPLKTILEETAKFLNWGYYFSFFSKGPESEALLAELSEKAVDYLIKGEADSFADILSHSYCHILDLVRDFLAECGLPEAGKILTPQIQFYKI